VLLDIVHRPVLLFKKQRFGGPEVGTSSLDLPQLSSVLPEDQDRIRSLKHFVLNKKQDDE
jgi:hypothetical protein